MLKHFFIFEWMSRLNATFQLFFVLIWTIASGQYTSIINSILVSFTKSLMLITLMQIRQKMSINFLSWFREFFLWILEKLVKYVICLHFTLWPLLNSRKKNNLYKAPNHLMFWISPLQDSPELIVCHISWYTCAGVFPEFRIRVCAPKSSSGEYPVSFTTMPVCGLPQSGSSRSNCPGGWGRTSSFGTSLMGTRLQIRWGGVGLEGCLCEIIIGQVLENLQTLSFIISLYWIRVTQQSDGFHNLT